MYKKLAALIVAAHLTSCSTLQQPTRDIASESSEMEYVEVCKPSVAEHQSLAKDCKRFSRLVMGTDHLVQADWTNPGQPEISEEELFAILDEAVRLGINIFDTSPIYVGGIENKLGKWLKSRKGKLAQAQNGINPELHPDKTLYTLSKGGFPFDLYYAKKLEPGTHSPQLKAQLRERGILSTNKEADGSTLLKDVPPGTYASRLYGSQPQIVSRVAEELGHTVSNLNGDITVYLMHRDDGDFIDFKEVQRNKMPVKDIMTALSKPEIAGKFWGLGWSNWKTARIDESVELAQKNSRLVNPLLNSPYFSLFEMTQTTIHAGGVQVTHKEMLDPNFQKGIKIMPYSPLGGFSVLDKPEPVWENAKKDAKKKFDDGDAYWKNVYHSIFTDANEARFNRVVEFTKQFNNANRSNYTIDQMINAYALAHDRTDFLAIGPITVEQLRRTVGAIKLSRLLTKKQLAYLYSGN